MTLIRLLREELVDAGHICGYVSDERRFGVYTRGALQWIITIYEETPQIATVADVHSYEEVKIRSAEFDLADPNSIPRLLRYLS